MGKGPFSWGGEGGVFWSPALAWLLNERHVCYMWVLGQALGMGYTPLFEEFKDFQNLKEGTFLR